MGNIIRYMIEFFLPKLSSRLVYPIGIVAQDKNGCVYKVISKDKLLFDVNSPAYDFYAPTIREREKIMTENILSKPSQPFKHNKELGCLVSVCPNEPEYLDWLMDRGIIGHFWFGPVHEIEGVSAPQVASEQAERLSNREEQMKVIFEFNEETTPES